MITPPDVLRDVAAINLGLPAFGAAVADQGAPVAQVDWRPPADGDPAAIAALTRLWGAHGERVAAANATAVQRIEAAAPRAIDVVRAGDVIDGLDDRVLLHSGPPIAWERVCDPQRRALLAAVLFEGWAPDRDRAARMLAGGEITLRPGNEHGHVG
ncbi:MAG: hypothetical protein QOC64_896, partial [Solirubrobacteraceae bacterium]|nr:hypothetical protein [Solirubrobacteraceae bacterium]